MEIFPIIRAYTLKLHKLYYNLKEKINKIIRILLSCLQFLCKVV